MGVQISGTHQGACFEAAKYTNQGIEPIHIIAVMIK
jgi:hypothetical protein